MEGTEVSDEMNAVLNRIAGEMPQETEDTRSFLSETARAAGFSRCTWFGSCYYCQRISGRWVVVKCAEV